MCGRHWHKAPWNMGQYGTRQEQPRAEAPGTPYEGETMRLDVRGQEENGYAHAARWHSFPWWVLWFIWPLIWIVKGVAAALVAIVGGVGEMLPHVVGSGFSFWPLILILIGIALWRKR